jgi:hypothetical protein
MEVMHCISLSVVLSRMQSLGNRVCVVAKFRYECWTLYHTLAI